MLSRFISKPSYFNRYGTLISSQIHGIITNQTQQHAVASKLTCYIPLRNPHFSFFSTNGKHGGDDSISSTIDLWKLTSEVNGGAESVFSDESGTLAGIHDSNDEEVKVRNDIKGEIFGRINQKRDDHDDYDIFSGVENKVGAGVKDIWGTEGESKPWNFAAERKEGAEEDFFDVGGDGGQMDLRGLGGGVGKVTARSEKSKEDKLLESEEKALVDALKGSNSAVGDLIASSGIT